MKTVKTEKKIKVSDLAEFDMTRHLKSKRAMTEYLNQVIADGDDAGDGTESTAGREHGRVNPDGDGQTRARSGGGGERDDYRHYRQRRIFYFPGTGDTISGLSAACAVI